MCWHHFWHRHREPTFLQYTCRNFPRVRTWQTPSFFLDCDAREVDLPLQRRKQDTLAWDSASDYSTVVYRPPKVTCFIIVLSAQGHAPERDQLRRGWLRSFQGFRSEWDYGFFAGDAKARPQPSGDAVQMLGDMVALPVPDDYPRLGEKVLAALQWTLENVETDYILKVDEDTWVNADRVASWLQRPDLVEADSGDWYGGLVRRSPVLRTGRWGVPTALYAASEYPPYAKGGGYVLSARTASRIVKAVRTGLSPPLSNVEDAMVGLAATALNVTAKSLEQFRELPLDYAQRIQEVAEECCDLETLLYHKPLRPDVCDACSGIAATSDRTSFAARDAFEPTRTPARTVRTLSDSLSPALSPMLSPLSLAP